MKTGSQAEFSREYGYSRAAITQFKNNGRLVFQSKGVLDFDASIKKIQETSDPNRDDVVKRHKRSRKAEVQQSAESEDAGSTFQDSRAFKERYLGLQAKIDYEKSLGLLVERSEVERDFIRIATIMRSAFERIPDFLAAELATENDPNRIRAMLTEEIEAALKQGADQITKLK